MVTGTLARAIVALTMSIGLVTSAGAAAGADPCCVDPYPGYVRTTTTVTTPGTVKKRRTATVCATVSVASGTGSPVGTLTLTVTKNVGSFSQSASYAYPGVPVCLITTKLMRKGGYTVAAYYTRQRDSVYKSSAGLRGFDVVGRRR